MLLTASGKISTINTNIDTGISFKHLNKGGDIFLPNYEMNASFPFCRLFYNNYDTMALVLTQLFLPLSTLHRLLDIYISTLRCVLDSGTSPTQPKVETLKHIIFENITLILSTVCT